MPWTSTASTLVESTARSTRSANLQQRCAALDTWRRWAAGATIDGHELGAAVDTLLTATGPDAHHCRALGQVVQHWANATASTCQTRNRRS